MTVISDADGELVGEELEDFGPPPPKLLEDTPGELERFRREFYYYFPFKDMSEDEKLWCLSECLKLSKSRACLVLKTAEDNHEITDFDSAFSLIRTYFEQTCEIKNYLETQKASLEQELKLVDNGWFQKRGYYLNGIAFPLILKFGERCLPIFLTCAHCAKKKRTTTYKSHVILTPARSPTLNDSFIFPLDPTDRQTGIFGCDAMDTDKAGALDFLVLFLKDKTNEGGQQIKNYWTADKKIQEGDPINMATTHAYISQSSKDIPVIQEGKVENVPAFIDGELIESVALHDVVGISSISGECLYTVETNKFECRLMFRGELVEPEASMPTYIGLPIACVKKELEENVGADLLNWFWCESLPKDVKTGGFVESYLVLITDEVPDEESYEEEESENEDKLVYSYAEAEREMDEDNEESEIFRSESASGGNGELNVSDFNPELIVDADDVSSNED